MRAQHGCLRARIPALCGIALALITFEVAFRFLLFGTTYLDPRIHRVVRTERHRLGEGFGLANWDERGIRLSPHACANCPQVLVIGDSYTEGFQVNDDQTYAAVAESLLAAQRPLRLLNAGFATASPANYVVDAARYRRRIKPTWVIIQLSADDLGPDAFHQDKVHFRQERDGLKLEVPAPYDYGLISRTLGGLRERSALLNFAIGHIDVARHGPTGPPWFRAGSEATAPVVVEAPRTYPLERELDLMRSSYENRVTFLFLPLFNHPVENEETRFVRYCQMTHVSCVNFRSSFGEFQRAGTAPYGFPNSRFAGGHLNAAGHEAVARLLVAEIRRLEQHGLF